MERRDQASVRRARLTPLPTYAAAQTTLALILLLLVSAFLHAPAAHAVFGFKQLSVAYSEEDGTPATQAGSHPFAATTSLDFNTEIHPQLGEIGSGQPKDLRIELPAGLLGQASAAPRCSKHDFNTLVGVEPALPACPDESVVGFAVVRAGAPDRVSAGASLFNLAPLPGELARLGFAAESFQISFGFSLKPSPPYGLLVSLSNISQSLTFFGADITLWGEPSDPAHDDQRGRCGAYIEKGPIRLEADPEALCPVLGLGSPFLSLPPSCGPPPPTIFSADSWAAPGAWVSGESFLAAAFTGCAKLPFSPVLGARPTTAAAAAPSGLDLTLEAPNPGLTSPSGLAAASLAAAKITFPPEMTINPALAAGLAACTPTELALETPTSAPGEGCPQAAKIATATATTPLLERPVDGTIFVAEPDDPATAAPGAENPLDAPYALYLILRDPGRGILITQPIAIEADPDDGRLTATLDQIPQLPLSHLELRFNSGPHAPLTTPATCASHTIAYTLTSSSGNAPLQGSDSFTTSASDCGARFAPTLAAGTSSNAAGRSAPFLLDLQNPAASSNLSALNLTLPPGLAAGLNATICPEPDAATATCPPDSRLGYARIALGPGSEPLWTPSGPGHDSAVYLAGPYRGAPYSLLISVPAEAGPFDLGTVITRAAIFIDPKTARARVVLDPLPQILAGVPLRYRTIRLILDRPGFIRNPTSCAPTQVTATAISAAGTTAALSDRFQAADCAALGLKPRLSLRLSGGIGRNAHPTVTVDIRPRHPDANLRSARLTLPYGIFLDPTRLPGPCTRERFAAHDCPPAAQLGWLEARSPLLPEPQRGRLYLTEGDHRLPDLAASLTGPVDLDLHGRLDTPHGRIRASFDSLPDVPLTHLRLLLHGGRRGLLVTSRNLCRSRPRAAATFAGHNGHRRWLRRSAAISCWRLTVVH